MAERYRRRSALAHLGLEARASAAAGDAGVTLRESPMRGLLVLRGDAAGAEFRGAVAAVLGLEPVVEPLTSARRRDVSMLWLGPDEWLVVTPPNVQAWLIDSLEASLEDVHASVTDLTGGYTTISLSGPRARDVLAKGCPLDLHPAVFSPGDCAQTLVAKAGAMIRCVDDSPSFELVVRRSFAEYAALWLGDAALEYGGGLAPNG